MKDSVLRFAMWLFDAELQELAWLPTQHVLDKEKTVTLSQLALVDSVLWATFGRHQTQVKFDC